MANRPVDAITVETNEGVCSLYQSVELSQDFLDVATLTMTIGDDGSWQSLSALVAPGRAVRCFLNGRLQFTGRFEDNEVPVDTASGSVVQVTARTKMSDARFASADPKTKYLDVSIRDFILSLYAPLGYGPSDFVFDASADRNLMTGQAVGQPTIVDLAPLQEQRAKVKPPETIFEAAKRHLARYHLAHWDSADGRIVVGAPNDTQAPLYRLLGKRGAAGVANNITNARRVKDWSEVPSEIRVFGATVNDDNEQVPFVSRAQDADLLAVAAEPGGHFFRPVHLPVEGMKTQAKASSQATRELASRSKRKDAWEITCDGWTYWDGTQSIPFTFNATADVDIETIGAEAAGRYLIHRVSRSLDVHGSAASKLSLVAPGIMLF